HALGAEFQTGGLGNVRGGDSQSYSRLLTEGLRLNDKRAGPQEVNMAQTLYTAQATVTGGRDHGHGLTSDGALEVQLRTPKEMGGGGGGTNPEQLFAVGYAACFEGGIGRGGAARARRARRGLHRFAREP